MAHNGLTTRIYAPSLLKRNHEQFNEIYMNLQETSELEEWRSDCCIAYEATKKKKIMTTVKIGSVYSKYQCKAQNEGAMHNTETAEKRPPYAIPKRKFCNNTNRCGGLHPMAQGLYC
jgi:hypothetical protein